MGLSHTNDKKLPRFVSLEHYCISVLSVFAFCAITAEYQRLLAGLSEKIWRQDVIYMLLVLNGRIIEAFR